MTSGEGLKRNGVSVLLNALRSPTRLSVKLRMKQTSARQKKKEKKDRKLD